MSEPAGAALLQQDMTIAEYAVQKALKIDANDGQFAALVDFVFNVGAGNFNKSTLLKRVNARQFDAVPYEFSRWTKAGGRVLPGLVTRRKKEAVMFGKAREVAMPTPESALIDVRLGELPDS
jgi:GH24 family phage-related lysozyme (muramidase)